MPLTTQHETSTVQELVDLYGKGRLNLSPAFQRQSVWGAGARQLLIQSILDAIPIPSIFLYKRVGHGGTPIFDVIDGKQRLETILLFLGRGPLVKSEELWVRRQDEDGSSGWVEWRDLGRAARHGFLTTRVSTIEVQGELSEIIDLFVRINSTGTSLTAQERRHARYFTKPVLRVAQREAERYRPTLVRNRIVTSAQVQRMKHVELMTELLLGVNAGVHLNKKAKIDEIIKGGGPDAADLRRAVTEVHRAVGMVFAILPDIKDTRFRRLSDFYSLVLLMNSYREEGKAVSVHARARIAAAGSLLREFGQGVDEVSDRLRRGVAAGRLQEPFREYHQTVLEGVDSAQQRRKREKVLRSVLDGVFDDLDPNRGFNSVQRRILWNNSSRKRCSICNQSIERWEDMSIDHVYPYIRGGRTSIRNAALAHRRCNAGKGAKTTRG